MVAAGALEISPCAAAWRMPGRTTLKGATAEITPARETGNICLTAESPGLPGKFHYVLGSFPDLHTSNPEESGAPDTVVPRGSTYLICATFSPVVRPSWERDRVFSTLRLLPTIGAQKICSECVQTRRTTWFKA